MPATGMTRVIARSQTEPGSSPLPRRSSAKRPTNLRAIADATQLHPHLQKAIEEASIIYRSNGIGPPISRRRGQAGWQSPQRLSCKAIPQ